MEKQKITNSLNNAPNQVKKPGWNNLEQNIGSK